MALSARLAERGYLVPAIRPPTVPEGSARLRVSLCADHEAGECESLARAIAEALGE
jgi:8-amino-7-oxononanoate synthase